MNKDKPDYLLDGYYETEIGVIHVYCTGDSLEDCVRRSIKGHPDFGNVRIWASGGYLCADKYDVTQDIYKMLEQIKEKE